VLIPSVAHPNIQVSVRTELKLPALMIDVRLVDRHHNTLGRWIDNLCGRIDVELGDHGLQVGRRRRVVRVKETVLGELGMERDAQQAALVIEGDLLRNAGQVEVGRFRKRAILVQTNASRLFEEEHSSRRIMYGVRGALEPEHRLEPDPRKFRRRGLLCRCSLRDGVCR